METPREKMLRLAMESRQRKADVIRENVTLDHRRIYTIGQMTMEVLHDVPDFVTETEGRCVIHLSLFEDYVKALSGRSSSHRILLSELSVSEDLKHDLSELAQNNIAYAESVIPYNRVVPEADQITKYTNKSQLLKRRKYLIGKIMLHYFPELPPLTEGTNEEYRGRLVQYMMLLNSINDSMEQYSRVVWKYYEKEDLL